MVEREWADFHRLDSRLRLVGEIKTITGLHVGSGTPGISEGLDQPVLRDGLGLPFIPGSSIKGVIRSTLEALVRALDGAQDRGPWSCDPLSKGCGSHGAGGREAASEAKHCTICRIFGSQVVASHVRISDAVMSGSDRVVPIEVRDGVAIDRDTGTASRGLKYDFEVVPPGVTFGLEVFVENPQDWVLGLLMLGFDQVDRGYTALGGFGSRGLGRVKVEWNQVESFKAADLLAGKPPEVSCAEQIRVRRGEWSDALKRHLEGR